MKYTAVIRTLGKAGEKYQKLLDSLAAQTIKPEEILVYIAEGYDIPRETIGIEKYIYVKKGMVAQRALPYVEVKTDYILFLDDDLCFPSDEVERMFTVLKKYNADVISPDIYSHHNDNLKSIVSFIISGRMIPRHNDDWGYKVMRTCGFSFNRNPQEEAYPSQTNAGAAFLCKKKDFLKIHFEDELWLDNQKYAIGDDQVMYYKMHLNGLKILTYYNSRMIHLDAGGNLNSKESEKRLVYADYRFKTIFWHRFLYPSQKNWFLKQWSKICILYAFGFGLLSSIFKCQFAFVRLKFQAIKDGIKFNNNNKHQSYNY